MIKTFRNKQLADLWETSKSKGIDKKMFNRILRRLEILDVAKRPEDMNVPGFNYHKLNGKPVRYSVHVNGPWCVTFEMDGEDATQVDFEQYH